MWIRFWFGGLSGYKMQNLGVFVVPNKGQKRSQYLPVYPQRGPPTARSGYVHLGGLHTGLSRDAVPAGVKGKDVSQGFKKHNVLNWHPISNTGQLYRTNSWYICFSTFILDCLPAGSYTKVAAGGHSVTKGHRGARLKWIATKWCVFFMKPNEDFEQ